MEKLNRDALSIIAMDLSPSEVLSLCQTSKILNEKLCQQDSFWLNKLRKDYPFYQDFGLNASPVEIYKAFYKVDLLQKEKNTDPNAFKDPIRFKTIVEMMTQKFVYEFSMHDIDFFIKKDERLMTAYKYGQQMETKLKSGLRGLRLTQTCFYLPKDPKNIKRKYFKFPQNIVKIKPVPSAATGLVRIRTSNRTDIPKDKLDNNSFPGKTYYVQLDTTIHVVCIIAPVRI